MRRIPLWFFCLLLIFAVAGPLLAQDPCSGKGLFARRLKGGGIEYCWYGTHYTESNAPEKVRAFFAKAVEKSNASRKNDAGSRSTVSRESAARSRAATSVPVSTQPARVPVDAKLIATIQTGAERDYVLATLGEPHGSISNLGEEGTEESWSYQLPDGGIAKVRLDRGKVTAVQLPR